MDRRVGMGRSDSAIQNRHAHTGTELSCIPGAGCVDGLQSPLEAEQRLQCAVSGCFGALYFDGVCHRGRFRHPPDIGDDRLDAGHLGGFGLESGCGGLSHGQADLRDRPGDGSTRVADALNQVPGEAVVAADDQVRTARGSNAGE